jgi:hypothetical protein
MVLRAAISNRIIPGVHKQRIRASSPGSSPGMAGAVLILAEEAVTSPGVFIVRETVSLKNTR